MNAPTKNFSRFRGGNSRKWQESAPESGLKRRVLAYNDKLFLASMKW